MALSSGHSVKFVSLKDFLVVADLLLPKSPLCLEGVQPATLRRGAAITLCYLLSDGLSLLQKRAALPFVSGPAHQVSPAGGGCGDGKSVAQGLLFEEGKRSL